MDDHGLVVTTTGTGWVDPAASDSLEYEVNGDTAAGRQLFDQVYAAWSALPSDHRPRLCAFGESLGSFGGEAAFSGLADVQNRTDGVLFAGPPNVNTLWRGSDSAFTRHG